MAFHHTAIALAAQCAGIQPARYPDDTRIAAVQRDPAALALQGPGFDGALVVDHRLQQAVRASGGHQHLPAVGLQQAAVLRQGVHRGAVHLQVEQAVAVEVDAEVIARAERHAAHLRLDNAIVADPGTQQRHAATFGGRERTGVAHGGGGTAGEAVVAVDEVLITDVLRRSHQAANVDLGGLAEHHAIGVDQEHLAIGVNATLYIATIVANHPVEGDRVAAGLAERDAFGGAHTEFVPVGDQLVAALIDGHLLAIALNGPATRDHRRTSRQGKRRRLPQQAQQRYAGRDHHLATARLTTATGEFAGDIPATQCLVPNQCIALVHHRSSSVENSAAPSRSGTTDGQVRADTLHFAHKLPGVGYLRRGHHGKQQQQQHSPRAPMP